MKKGKTPTDLFTELSTLLPGPGPVPPVRGRAPREVIELALRTLRRARRRAGLPVLGERERLRLMPLARTANLAISRRYEGFLRKYPQVAERSVGAEVFTYLSQAAGALSSLNEAAGSIGGALLQGVLDEDQALREGNEKIEELLALTDPGRVVEGMSAGDLRVLFAKGRDVRAEEEKTKERREKKRKRQRARLSGQVEAARERLREETTVARFRRAGRGDLPEGGRR